jgi:hypothetical protein
MTVSVGARPRILWLCRIAVLAAIVLAPGICAATTISIAPSVKTVALNQEFTLDVNITDVTDLAAYQFQVQFDGTVLEATACTDGGLFGAAGFFFPCVLNASPGLTTFVGAFVDPGVTAPGTNLIVVLGFRAIGAGTSAVSLMFDAGLNDGLFDSSFIDPIAFDTEAASVTVNAQPTAVPEPGTLFLLLSGGAALVRSRTRKDRPGRPPTPSTDSK